MSSTRLRKTAMRWAPRLVSLSVLFGIFCSLAPFAVGQQSEKDLSEPFPCQHRACGCRSATQCWKRCCCFSNAQKLAWARVNDVQPPEYVIQSAERESSPAKCDSSGCCHLPTSAKKSAAVPTTQVGQPDQTVYVVAFLAHQCQGHHWYWNSLPWTILPPVAVLNDLPHRAHGKLALASEKLLIASQQPPVPPPR